MNERKIEKFVREALGKQMTIAGYSVTVDNLQKEEDGWCSRYTMTTEQHSEWEDWFFKKAKKLFKWNKKKIREEFGMFDLMWGLKIKDND